MGFGFRKSIKLGKGTKLNLSKSGFGISYGIKGLRISTNSKGSTLYAGRKGVYYRKKLTSEFNGTTNNNFTEIDEQELSDILDIEDEFEYFMNFDEQYLSQDFEKYQQKRNKLFLISTVCFFSGLLLWFIPWIIGIFICYKKRKELDIIKLKNLSNNLSNSLYDYLKNDTVEKKYYNACNLDKCKIGVEEFEFIIGQTAYIKFGMTKFYFLSEGLFCISEDNKGYFIPYGNIKIEKQFTKVITFNPPKNAEIISATWEHTNKDGSPNKRYKINRKLFNINATVIVIKSQNNFIIPILTITEDSANNLFLPITDLMCKNNI